MKIRKWFSAAARRRKVEMKLIRMKRLIDRLDRAALVAVSLEQYEAAQIFMANGNSLIRNSKRYQGVIYGK